MSFWNFRVVRILSHEETFFEIRECHYDESQRGEKRPAPESISTSAAAISSESGNGLYSILTQMEHCCSLPVVDFETRQNIGNQAAVFAREAKKGD